MSQEPVFCKFSPDKEFYFREGCWINELSNSEQDPALSIARARLSPGETTQWHRLQGTVERYVVISGQGLAELESVEGKKSSYPVQTGDSLVIPVSFWQRISNTGEEDLVFLALCTPRFMPQIYEERLTSGRSDYYAVTDA